MSWRRQREAYAQGRALRVVNWHATPRAVEGVLRAELAGLLRDHVPATLEDLDAFHDTGRWPSQAPRVLVALYDGYRDNVEVAVPVCEELGVTAWFFPPTGFLDAAPEDQRAFAAAYDVDLVPEHEGADRIAMTWDELARVGERHVVAAHTARHSTGLDLVTREDVEREVLGPCRAIERAVGRAPAAFAFYSGTPYDPSSVAGRALLEAGVRYAVTATTWERIR
ncbi:polysaccharide deacetylase family protein [Vallicoccus soli]|uniref:Polysaccharide deacetylase family protein n=1 Tax=Vallicoccus soli TaxID=2339232 RepID=A0A3A3ZGB7_9ACTN|nr:polysaccharide deacetylase family protein [Vallicoccus soli]RJK94242.1 polysaccharide deacetylase family protein [Vallicoccus soli]